MSLAIWRWGLIIGALAFINRPYLVYAQSPSLPGPNAEAAIDVDTRGVALELAPGVRFEVVELRRLQDKGVMQLRFAVINESSRDTSLKDHGLAFNQELRDIAVVDFTGRKRYSIGHAASCLCSTFKDRDGGMVRAGERREFWAWFGMPPDGVRQMAVQIPNLQPLMNVPLL